MLTELLGQAALLGLALSATVLCLIAIPRRDR